MSLGNVGAIILSMAYIILCISDALLALGNNNSMLIKVIAFGLISLSIIIRPRFHRLIGLLLPLLLVLCVSLIKSFNVNAGLEELFRFLSPVTITIALFAYRDRLAIIVVTFLGVVITNDLAQCYFYLAYVAHLPSFMPYRIDSGLFLRAQGWIGFFSEFSFMNFCAFLLYRWLRPATSSKVMKSVFILFSLLGFSFKIFATWAIYPFLIGRKGIKAWVCIGLGLSLTAFVVVNGYVDSLLDVGATKLSFYVIDGNSARAESYRVMAESLESGNFAGEGLGAFGGPASIAFNSPTYAKYHFDWFGLSLATTDTFYPHLVVETGVVGAILWMAMMLLYGQRCKRAIWMFVVGAFCFDNIFSMAFLSPSYVFSALLLMHVFSQINYTDILARRLKMPPQIKVYKDSDF